MEIGKKLKNARIEAGLTQEKAAEKIDVSRQTISNWENEKSYPDIISVIALSDLYSVSLDELLKGDQKMAEHLEESTNVVKSNKKLTGAILLNIILMILLIALNMLLPEGTYYLVIVFCVVIMSSSVLLYQIINGFRRQIIMGWNQIAAVASGAIALVGAICTAWQIYQMTVSDAKARGLKHPKFWGFWAMNGNNSSGLILYLIGRRKYPVQNMSIEDQEKIETRKKAAGAALVFMTLGAIGFVINIMRIYI